MNCRFEIPFDINSHDCDLNNVLRPSGYLKYLQECANLQIEHAGFGYDNCKKNDCAFVLSRLALTVHQPVYAYDRVLARTSASDSRGVSYNRGSELIKNGSPAASLTSVWALVGISDRRLIRVADSRLTLPVGDPPAHSAPLKFRIPDDLQMKEAGQFSVGYSVCDRNRHMNNTRYPDMYCDLLPDLTGRMLHELSVNYLCEAPMGEVLRVFMAEDREVFCFRAYRTSDGRLANEARMTFYPLPFPDVR